MIKDQIFVNKHLPVQIPNATDVMLVLLLSLFDMILICTLLFLFIPHSKWYNVLRCRNSNSPHLIELFSNQFLENFPKITNQLFSKKFFGWLLYANK